MHDSSSRIPWRSTSIAYLNNEVTPPPRMLPRPSFSFQIYFDQIEYMDCIVGSNEVITASQPTSQPSHAILVVVVYGLCR